MTFPLASVSITGVTLDRVSRVPLCLDLSAHSDASPRTISLVSTTQSPPPPLPPPHSLSLARSVWHLPIPDLFPIPSSVSPPLSSSHQLLSLQLVAQPSAAASPVLPACSLSVSLVSSPTSAALFLTFFHFHTLWHSISNTYATDYSKVCTCPWYI